MNIWKSDKKAHLEKKNRNIFYYTIVCFLFWIFVIDQTETSYTLLRSIMSNIIDVVFLTNVLIIDVSFYPYADNIITSVFIMKKYWDFYIHFFAFNLYLRNERQFKINVEYFWAYKCATFLPFNRLCIYKDIYYLHVHTFILV